MTMVKPANNWLWRTKQDRGGSKPHSDKGARTHTASASWGSRSARALAGSRPGATLKSAAHDVRPLRDMVRVVEAPLGPVGALPSA